MKIAEEQIKSCKCDNGCPSGIISSSRIKEESVHKQATIRLIEMLNEEINSKYVGGIKITTPPDYGETTNYRLFEKICQLSLLHASNDNKPDLIISLNELKEFSDNESLDSAVTQAKYMMDNQISIENDYSTHLKVILNNLKNEELRELNTKIASKTIEVFYNIQNKHNFCLKTFTPVN